MCISPKWVKRALKNREGTDNMIINEGGKAVKGDRIPREFIFPTVKNFEQTYLKPILGLTLLDCPLLGSTGKKEQSGDIDIAIPVSKLWGISDKDFFSDFHRYLKNAYAKVLTVSKNAKLNLAFRQIHSAFPQFNENKTQIDKTAQIDIIFGNPNYLTFSSSGFPGETKFDSWVRNAMLSAAARMRIIDRYTTKKMSYTVRLSYSVYSGLLEKIEYQLPEKGSPVKLMSSRLVTNEPRVLVSGIFNGDILPEQVRLAEDVIDTTNRLAKEGKFNLTEFKAQFLILAEQNDKDPTPILEMLDAE